MAISSIGNLNFINQNAQVSSLQQAGAQHRADIAHVANMQDFKEKLNEDVEIKKPQEEQSINPDRDFKHQQSPQEKEAKADQEEEKKEEEVLPHLLDIKA